MLSFVFESEKPHCKHFVSASLTLKDASIVRHKLKVRPGVSGPYLVPKTAEDGASASDNALAVSDVLEDGKSTRHLVLI